MDRVQVIGRPAKPIAVLLLAALVGAGTLGSVVETREGEAGASGLWQALLELRSTAVALHITAHPDDEDGPTLTYLARAMGARTLLLAVNRGEGGADLIAPYTSDALGVLRTLEMIEAARHYGAEPFFTRLADYGYSKSLDEALAKWGDDNILRDAVGLIRRERPDIILSRFRGDPREGHATTYVVERMARLAFAAAADPNRFPEQIQEGLRPFQAKKLYVHNQRPDGEPRLPELTTVVVPTGDLDPFLGRSYFEIARAGYYMHRTQGTFDRLSRPGPFDVHYQLVQSTLPGSFPRRETSFFDGLDTSIEGLASLWPSPPPWLPDGLRQVSASVERAMASFEPRAPEETVPPLLEGLEATRALRSRIQSLADPGHRDLDQRLERKEEQFQRAVSTALGLDLDAAVTSTENVAPFRTAPTLNHAVPGDAFEAQVRLINRSALTITVERIEIQAPDGWTSTRKAEPHAVLGFNQAFSATFQVRVAERAEPSRPYWGRDSIEESVHRISDERLVTQPLPDPPAWGVASIEVNGVPILMRTPIHVTRPDPPRPALAPPLTVVPAMSVRFTSERGVMRHDGREYEVSVGVRSGVKGRAGGSVSLVLPAGWTSVPSTATFSFAREDDEATFRFRLSLPGGSGEQDQWLRAVVRYKGQEFEEGYRTITAPDLGRFNHFEPARHLVRPIRVEVPSDLRVGYVMGAAERVPDSLAQIGVQPTLLKEADLAEGDLDRFDAIVMGIRAYTLRPDVRSYNARLLEYAHRGGVLIVQYQTPEFDRDYGPYPYSMTRAPEEVSEEDSEVQILAPENPLFLTPNLIAPADFEGWIEERGSKFMTSRDGRYTPLLQTHDRKQKPQSGGWLYAPYGKGAYIYCAYAFHRQLPYGVPGAFRMYVNMLSLRRTLSKDR